MTNDGLGEKGELVWSGKGFADRGVCCNVGLVIVGAVIKAQSIVNGMPGRASSFKLQRSILPTTLDFGAEPSCQTCQMGGISGPRTSCPPGYREADEVEE